MCLEMCDSSQDQTDWSEVSGRQIRDSAINRTAEIVGQLYYILYEKIIEIYM